ncbi:MAG: hypothetical protein ACK5X9_11925, partial [Alphaproteobacteria bacterium]
MSGVLILSGDGNDVPVATGFNDTIDGGNGNDSIAGLGGDDSLLGGLDNDIIRGDGFPGAAFGADTILGGTGLDTLFGGEGNDSVFGEDGANLIFGEDGADSLIGGNDSDTISSGIGADSILGGNGADSIIGMMGGESLDSLAPLSDGNDTVLGGNGADTIGGGNSDDVIQGDAGADSIFGNAGNDTISGGDDADTIYGGNGNDLLQAGAGNDRLFGEAGNDSFAADSMSGSPFVVYFDGGAGDDVFRLNDGEFTIIGGSGNDRVELLFGNETISLAPAETDGVSGIDHIVLSGANLQLLLSAADVLRLTDSGILRVSGADGNAIDTTDEGWVQGASADGFTTFINGAATVLVADNLLEDEDQGATLSGTEGNDSTSLGLGSDSYLGLGGDDSVLGNAGNDTIDGGAGGDTIYGAAGNDSILGGTGADCIYGNTGDDTVLGGDGNDTLFGSEGTNSVDGGVGDDQLHTIGSGRLSGGNGNDVLNGNAGNDTLLGGNDADTINASAGDDSLDGGLGNDLYLMANATGNVSLIDGGGSDTVSLLGGAADITSGNDLIGVSGIEAIDLAGTGALLQLNATVVRSLSDTEMLTVYGSGNDSLVFEDASSWTRGATDGGFVTFTTSSGGNATVIAAQSLVPAEATGATTGDDTLTGTAGADAIDLLEGNDSYLGLDGNDSIIGNAGNDRLSGGNGADSILGGEGADLLIGGSGNDLLDGGNGSDLADYSADTGAQAVSVDLGVGRANDGLGGTDTLLGIENVVGGAGSDTMIGGNGADNLWGNSGNDSLVGGAGADTLDGGSGNDTIAGDSGDDRIFGGTGSDSIDAGAGTGDIVSFNHTSAQAVSATISAIGGSAGSNYAQVNSASQGNDTIINFENIQGSFENDGFTINSAATDNALLAVFGSIGADTIAVNSSSNAVMADYNTSIGSTNFTRGVIVDLNAGTADDGRGGIDSLIGVRGVNGSSFGDTILGSNFNDRFREQGGNDSINGRDGSDMLDYSGNSASQHASVNLADERATDGRGGSDTVIGMENVRGGSGNDTLIGNSADNELRGGNGADILDGGASGFDIADYANNTSAQAISVNLVAGRASDGFGFTDTLSSIEYVRGGAGNDTIIGSNANERFRGNAGDDTIDGGGGTNDILDLSQTTGAVSASLVTGRASDGLGGSDSFTGIEGLYSGTASDTLIGGAGNDFFDGGQSGDLIDGGAGIDRVRFDLVAGLNASITRGVSVNLAAQRATDGWGGQDTLIGLERVTATNFADTLLGDDVSNRFNGLSGSDSIDGGRASDWLEYSNSAATSGVMVNLTEGTASDGSGGTDIFTSIENVIGGRFGDHLTGIAQDGRATSRLRGGEGNDTLVGIDYGYDSEFVIADYSDQTMGLSVNLASGIVNDGLGGIDSLVNIRGAAMFGNFADTLIGSNGDDWLEPSGGNDSVMGGDGYDIIAYSGTPTGGVSVNLATGVASDGDGGTDTLTGIEAVTTGYSNDTVIGDSGDNLVGLSAGADYADGAGGTDMVAYDIGFSPNGVRYTSNEAGDQLPFTGVTIDLAAGRATDQGGAADTILNFEDAIGSTMHDSILGSAGDNYLDGVEGNDTINGGGGNDEIYSGRGADSLFGGDGDDNLYAFESTDAVRMDGGSGNDTLTGGAGGSTLSGGLGNDDLTAGYAGANSLSGDGGDDKLAAYTGVVTLAGGADNDTLMAQGGGSSLDGGTGDDVLSAGYMGGPSSLGEQAVGSDKGGQSVYVGNDNIISGLILSGGAGRDQLTGSYGNDTLLGGADGDTITGSGGADSLDGGAGNDLYLMANASGPFALNDSGGSDTVSFSGTTGLEITVDSLSGVSGINAINLAGGGNILRLTAAAVIARSETDAIQIYGSGNDSLVFDDNAGWTRGTTTDGFVAFTSGAATVIAAQSLVPLAITATNGNDTIIGTSGADAIDLLAGNDSYLGLAGNDSILGNAGNDSLSGDLGADTLAGGD